MSNQQHSRALLILQRRTLRGLIAAVVLLLNWSAASAATYVWNVPSGSWFSPGYWYPYGVPGSSDVAYVANNGTSTIGSGTAHCYDLRIGHASSTGNVEVSSGLANYIAYVGFTNTGSVTQSGGTNSIHDLLLGYYSTINGTYTLSTGTLAGTNQNIGYQGIGTFTQSGGANSASSYCYLGVISTATGTYTMSAGTLTSPQVIVGQAGIGTVTQSGGTATIASSLTLGSVNTGRGTYNLSDAGRINTPLQYVGNHGVGTFNQSGGTNSASTCLYLAYFGDAQGTYNLTNGNINAAAESIGHAATGTLTQSGGINTVTGNLTVGYNSGSNGTYRLQAGTLSATNESAGYSGNGAITHTGGTNTLSQNLYLGSNPSGSGMYSQSAGNLTAASEYVGNAGRGTYSQSGGVNTITSSTGLVLANSPTAYGTYNLSGGTLVLKNLQKGPGSAQFNFAAGTIQASDSFTSSMPMRLMGPGANSNFDTVGNRVTLSGNLWGDGGLNKYGIGELTLSGANIYTGPTNVNAGRLFVSGSLHPNGQVVVNSAGILTGTGSVANVTVNSGGHIAPGMGVGKLTLLGDLTLNAGALLDFDLGTVLASDLIAMPDDALNLNGQGFSNFIFKPLSGFGVGTYTLIDAGNVAGSLGWRSGLLSGYGAWLEVAGDDLLLHVNVVPEPSSFIIWPLVGLAVFGGVRRRRKVAGRAKS